MPSAAPARNLSLTPVPAAPVARRTQEERRTATRLALLDASAACLTELGYAGTTTTVVVERAGLSQGALFKHFPTKQALLAETAAHIYAGLRKHYVVRFGRLETTTDPDERLDRAIRLLWKMFESAEYGAALDLISASRTDTELRHGLHLALAEHSVNLRLEAFSLFPELAEHPQFAITLDLLLEAMAGMALNRIADPQGAHYRRLLDHLSELAHQRLADARAAAKASATAVAPAAKPATVTRRKSSPPTSRKGTR